MKTYSVRLYGRNNPVTVLDVYVDADGSCDVLVRDTLSGEEFTVGGNDLTEITVR